MLISERYRNLNSALHTQSKTFGFNGRRHKAHVDGLVAKYGAQSILDYGCGKGTLAKVMGPMVRNYDPAIVEFSADPEPADLVICTDVMEHVEPECVDSVLDHIRQLTMKAAYIVIAFRLAKKFLPDGRNAHICLQPAEWWEEKLRPRFKIVQWIVSEEDQEGLYEVVPCKQSS